MVGRNDLADTDFNADAVADCNSDVDADTDGDTNSYSDFYADADSDADAFDSDAGKLCAGRKQRIGFGFIAVVNSGRGY